MKYFLITCSEDGDVRVGAYERAELLAKLDEGYFGKLEFYRTIPDADPQYWGDGMALLLKGDMVIPFEVQSVTKHDVD